MRVSVLLSRMYEAMARPDTPEFAFSEFSVSPADGQELVLQGKDGWAVKQLAADLNRAFSGAD